MQGSPPQPRPFWTSRLGIDDFVNADVIAKGLSAFNPEGAAIQAGRIMLERVRELAARGRDFAFETTLASRSFAPWIASCAKKPDMNSTFATSGSRPRDGCGSCRGPCPAGGHFVPDDMVARRYPGRITNFFSLVSPHRRRLEAVRQFHRSRPSA